GSGGGQAEEPDLPRRARRVGVCRASMDVRMARPRDGWAVHEAASGEPRDIVPVERAVERVERGLREELDVIVREHDPRKATRVEAALITLAERRRVGNHDDLVLAAGEAVAEVRSHRVLTRAIDTADDD